MARITKKILPRFLLISFLTVILLIVSIRVSFPRILSGFLPDVFTESDAAALKAKSAMAASEDARREVQAAEQARYEAARRADRAADAATIPRPMLTVPAQHKPSNEPKLAERRAQV